MCASSRAAHMLATKDPLHPRGRPHIVFRAVAQPPISASAPRKGVSAVIDGERVTLMNWVHGKPHGTLAQYCFTTAKFKDGQYYVTFTKWNADHPSPDGSRGYYKRGDKVPLQ